MKFGKATIDITGNMAPLKTALSKAKAAVKSAALAMGRSLKKAFSAVVTKSIAAVKIGIAGLIATMALATRAAMKQEDSEFRLAAAISSIGEEVDKILPKYKLFASAIQNVTVIGDEDTLGLMQMGISLGLTTDKVEEATKMAIGLGSALGLDVSSSMRYVTLAIQGEFTMLNRYLPALRGTNDETEKMAILQEAAARGFKIAEAEANTASGAFKQLWNNLGDILEIIGQPIADTFKSMSKYIKENKDKMEEWGKKVADAITLGIDKITEYGKTLSDIFKADGWDGVKEELRTVSAELAQTIVDAMTPIIRKGIGDAILFSLKSLDLFKALQNLGLAPALPEASLKRKITAEDMKMYEETSGHKLSGALEGTLKNRLRWDTSIERLGNYKQNVIDSWEQSGAIGKRARRNIGPIAE